MDTITENSTNCDEYFKSEDSKFFINSLCVSEGKRQEDMSRFEMFAFVLSNLSLCSGSEFKREYLTAIENALPLGFSKAVICNLKNRELQMDIWRFIWQGQAFDDENNAAKINVEKYNFKNEFFENDILKKCDEKCIYILDFVDLNKNALLLKMQDKKAESLNKFIEDIFKNFENKRELKILLNADDFSVLRTDAFHSELAYQKVMCGEKYKYSEFSQILMWILGSAILCRKIKIFLYGKQAVKCACEMNEYFTSAFRDRADSRLKICISISDVSEQESLCRAIKDHKNISPALMISEESSASDNVELLRNFALKYPIGCVEYCNRQNETDNKKYFENVLELLRSVCEDDRDASACFERFLNKFE